MQTLDYVVKQWIKDRIQELTAEDTLIAIKSNTRLLEELDSKVSDLDDQEDRIEELQAELDAIKSALNDVRGALDDF